MGWLIALAVIVLLGILPLGVSAKYSGSGAVIKLIAGPVRLQVFPAKKKKQPKEKKASAKKKPEPQTKAQPATEEKTGGSLTDFLPMVRHVLDFLGDLRRKLRLDRLEMKLVMAGDDPCDLAVNYGRACGALGALEPQLSRLFVIKKKDLDVQCDFTGDKTLIWARVDLTITVGRILSLGIRYGFRVIREYLRIIKLRKGGAVQ